MFELVDKMKLKNNLYYVKTDTETKGLVFMKYMYHDEIVAVFTYPYIMCYENIEIKRISVYRFVSKEEYYEKVKEKYDAKCLNIILKRLLDESFQL